MSVPLLQASDLVLRFGGLTSLDGVDLRLDRGEVLAVIGPNGAGKTSLFNCLTGVYRPQEGRIAFTPEPGRTVDLLGRRPHQITRLGLARTFQNIRLFNGLTTLENVKIGVESRQRTGVVGAMLRLPRARREERDSDRRAMELLGFVGLARRANDLAGALAYGEQRRLEIARALATAPAVLLLDEPAAGTNPAEKRELRALIERINATGVSVLLIEHDMGLVMGCASRVTVLNFGRVIADGSPAQVQRDPAVVSAYLGAPAGDVPGTGAPGSGAPGTGAPGGESS